MAENLTPITRAENFLARIAGDDGKVLEPITREEHFLQRIIDNGSGGGGGSALPSVDVSDNGKILSVVNGTWDKTDSNGPGLTVKFTYDSTQENTTCDKTFSQITEFIASDNNKHGIRAYMVQGQKVTELPDVRITYSGNSVSYVSFYGTYFEAKDKSIAITIASAGISTGFGESTPLPDVGSADNGRVLTVSNGSWTKGLPGGLPVVTLASGGALTSVTSEVKTHIKERKPFILEDGILSYLVKADVITNERCVCGFWASENAFHGVIDFIDNNFRIAKSDNTVVSSVSYLQRITVTPHTQNSSTTSNRYYGYDVAGNAGFHSFPEQLKPIYFITPSVEEQQQIYQVYSMLKTAALSAQNKTASVYMQNAGARNVMANVETALDDRRVPCYQVLDLIGIMNGYDITKSVTFTFTETEVSEQAVTHYEASLIFSISNVVAAIVTATEIPAMQV